MSRKIYKNTISKIMTFVLIVLFSNYHTVAKVLPKQVILLKKEILPSWNYTKNKKAIIDFVQKTVKNIPKSKRLATFDFDGTLGVEKPTYSEIFVSASKMCKKAEENLSLMDKQPYKASCNKNWNLINSNQQYTNDIILKSFQNQSLTEYENYAIDFLETNIHPDLNKTFNSLVYKPMIELIEYLLDNEFTVYIVSGSQNLFLRAMLISAKLPLDSSKAIGTIVNFEYVFKNGLATFIRDDSYKAPLAFNKGKVELIMDVIGKTPIFAAGNTMGDFQMLLTSTSGSLIDKNSTNQFRGFSLILNHDDSIREYQYTDKKLIQEAVENNWTIVSMKNDFKVVFDTSKIK